MNMETTHTFTISVVIKTPADGNQIQAEQRIQETHEHWLERLKEAVEKIPGAASRKVEGDWHWSLGEMLVELADEAQAKLDQIESANQALADCRCGRCTERKVRTAKAGSWAKAFSLPRGAINPDDL